MKISVEPVDQGNEKIYETSLVSNTLTPSWISRKKPNGEIFDLGTYFSEESLSVKIQLLNRTKQSKSIN